MTERKIQPLTSG